MSEGSPSDFEKAAISQTDQGFLAEYWYFLRHHKAWWLAPIIVLLVLFAVFLVLSQTAAAPFIYTLF
jgi:drug/metabolite transporter superfamily protein YnfA